MRRKFISCSFAPVIKELDGDHMIRGLVPTKDHLSVLANVMDGVHMIRGLVPTEDHLSIPADVMDGVHMIRGLVPTEDHLSVLADVMDGVQQPFHSFHEKTIALGWNFNDCGFIERDRVVFIDCHFVVVKLIPLDHHNEKNNTLEYWIETIETAE
ncbi:hypothetical protein EDB84DRAFT_1444331 [Lactarius hengduanensis]|nr:hypothetical protein EDB84DRAFT_1444331 [Lactarius hengduanensis]